MEEIDSIIIESLRNLHCDFEEDITSLKHFDPESTVNAISRCLEAINPETTFPKKLPPSMSLKLKITSSLAEQIKDLGFRDDIGYQTILYCNEVEIRRIFMFLIEKLPREQKIPHVEQTGYVPTLIKEIEQKIRCSFQQFWVPSCVLRHGCRQTEAGTIVHTFGNCKPLISKRLQVPRSTESETLKQYWIRNVGTVTQQCPSQLLPSLLFQDNVVSCDLTKCLSTTPSARPLETVTEATVLVENVPPEPDSRLQTLLSELDHRKTERSSLEKAINRSEAELEHAVKARVDGEEYLQKALAQVSLKSKTRRVLSKEENKQKLKNMVEASRTKLVKLTEQWQKIQTPLIEEYKSLQSAISNEDLKKEQQQQKLKKLEETHQSLLTDSQEKKQLEEQLRQKLEQVNKNHSRSGYTRRILEIIGNIKKQDEEIQKILKDTREVQREISGLTGQVDRSFTLADEMIFRDAKQDESARKAYKLLAQLRDDCLTIIKAVTDLGAVERECRNLQDQIDTETAKENAVKLERVQKDLAEVRKETESLVNQQT